MASPSRNRGRLINYINGISGVQAGGRMQINMPTDRRMHEIHLLCKGIAYLAATTLAVPDVAGTETFGFTVVAGQIATVTITAAPTAKADGDYTGKFVDSSGNGQGGTFSYTVATGNVTAVTITSPGIVSPVSPARMFTSFQQFVNGINMRDIPPQDIVNIANANQELESGQGIKLAFGELALYYSEPWRRIVENDEVNAWDLVGQNTFQIFGQITTDITNPSVEGIMIFDYIPQLRPALATDPIVIAGRAKVGEPIPYLQPVSQHKFVAQYQAGRNPIVTLPSQYPISRMWVYADTANITQLEVWQDGNMILQATSEQLKDAYNAYGFAVDVFKRTGGATPNDDAAAYISDPDNRLFRALSAKVLQVVVYLDAPANVSIIQENLPGAYQA